MDSSLTGLGAPRKPHQVARQESMRKSRGVRPLADLVGSTMSGICGRAGFSAVEIVTHWEDIAGALLGTRSMPVKLQWPSDGGQEATLVVRVEGAYALEMQYAAPQVIERVNTYFGWRCVTRLAIRQGPVPMRGVRKRPPPPDPGLQAQVRAEIGRFEDEALAQALSRLGALVRRARRET